MGNEIEEKPFKRIISLVPSQTELLTDLTEHHRIVGRTKFCIHPTQVVQDISVVGGTKQFHFDKIDALEPDLIVGNKEENYQDGIYKLMEKYPVWMSDISTIEDNYDMIRKLGRLLDEDSNAENIESAIRNSLSPLQGTKTGRVLYFIWQKPYIVAGKNTFIDHMLNFLGFENTCIQMRYPEMDQYILETLEPDHVFLSSEPFPFREKHLDQFRALFPEANIHLVDGEMFSWYGSRLMHSGAYFQDDLLSGDN